MLMSLWRCVEHGLTSVFAWETEQRRRPVCEACGRPLERIEPQAVAPSW